MNKKRGILDLPSESIYDEIDSPVGKLTIITSQKKLHAIFWENDRKNTNCEEFISRLIKNPKEEIIIKTKKQLAEYFQGKRKKFELPLALNGTSFQLQAWNQLLKIPYGKTISYAEQAEKVGDRNKARAVGMANGLNPISIVVPCHRVIGSNGQLVGFGGGLEKKAYLLELEKREK